MEKVGYDLYCKLLAEEISRLKGETLENIELECRIDIDLDAYIPSNYIPDDEGRMKLYSRIASIRRQGDREQLLQELKDIYGNVPKPLQNLVNVGLYKGLGVRAGCEAIKIAKSGGEIRFRGFSEKTAAALEGFNRWCVLKMTTSPIITFEGDSKNSVYELIFRFLTEITA
jgi:transcription-repair coupling factor (superfamily II helicase)